MVTMTNAIDKLKEKESDCSGTCTNHLCTTCHSHHDSSDVTICPRAIKYERTAKRWKMEVLVAKCENYNESKN